MSFLSDAEKETLANKIRQAESRTRAEIVTVIAQTSDGYRYIPMLWAALLALSVPGLYYLWSGFHHAGWQLTGSGFASVSWLYPAQVLTFLGCRTCIRPETEPGYSYSYQSPNTMSRSLSIPA